MHLFIDTETTGLPRAGVQPRIVSVAWIIADSLSQHHSLRYMIVRPNGFRIPEEASRIHGISTERAIKDGVPLDVALDGLALDVRTHKPTSIVAHNLAFDRPIVDAEYQRAGRASALSGLRGTCTVLLSQKRWPGQPATLNSVHQRLFGSGMTKQHDAHADVMACRRIYFELLKSPGAVAAAGGSGDPEDVDESMQEAAELIERIMTWAEDRPSFDTSFVESLQGQLEERGSLSPKQIAALENIASRFNI